MTGTPTATFFHTIVGMMRRSLWLIILAALALGVAWLRHWKPVRVEVVRLARGDVTEEAFGRGTIESEREAAVGFDLVGRLSEVLVDEGSRVALGQAVARLETDQAQADLRSAQTGIGAARASLQRLAAEEDRARALLTAAQREAGRTQTLADSGALSGQQRDEASDRLRLAQAELDRVLAQRAEATRGIDVAAGGAEQRRVAMVRATLLAPFEGLVTSRLREPGDTVTVGSTVLRIVDTSRVYVRAAVDETLLDRLAVDQPATIKFPGGGAPIRGRVTKISWEADRQTHELRVDVTPEALTRRVAIGQRADVFIQLRRQAHTLSLPTRMIYHDQRGPYVYVSRSGKIAQVRPTFGLTGADATEVLAGLTEGEAVLAAPAGVATLPLGRRWETP